MAEAPFYLLLLAMVLVMGPGMSALSEPEKPAKAPTIPSNRLRYQSKLPR